MTPHPEQEFPEVNHPRWDAIYPPLSGALETVLPVVILGKEDSGEPEIMTPNHLSFYEIIVQMKALYMHSGTPPTAMAKKAFFHPPYGPLITRLGGFKVDRDKPSMPQLTAYVANAQSEGRHTIIYPERSRHKGAKIPTQVYDGTFKDGALRIGRDLGMQVRPVGTVMRGFRRNLVHYGEAFSPEGVAKDELLERMQATLNLAVSESCELWGEDEVYNSSAVN